MGLTRVLVADDNVGYGTVLSHYVASLPDVELVGLASNGNDAVTLTRLLGPDVVVMDLFMPGMDGFEATRLLKELAEPPRVVALTAHRSEESRLLAAESGADAFLIKEDVDRALQTLIGDLIGREDEASS
jgi:CheY-like chemotaxis protein